MDRTVETILRKLITMALQLCLPLIPKNYACPNGAATVERRWGCG